MRSALKGEAKEAAAKRGENDEGSKDPIYYRHIFRDYQHQVPEVGGRQGPGQEGINA